MRNDLIERKAIINKIANECTIYESDGRMFYDAREIDRILNTIDATFDKGNVIERLVKKRDQYDINEEPKDPRDIWECADIREHKGKYIAYDEAIKIVGEGGASQSAEEIKNTCKEEG